MNSKLEIIAVKLCENLPFDKTILEKDGKCTKPSDRCRYCIPENESLYLCHKKTYTLDFSFRTV